MVASATASTLHPQLVDLIADPVSGEQSLAEARAAFVARYAALPSTPVDDVRDQIIVGPRGQLRLRLYRLNSNGQRPILIYFHGGGFVLGDLESHDALCRALCAGSGVNVVAVDYALAPEHPFPSALEDGLAAVRWVAGHADSLGGDAGRIALGGDSAGANLAIGCARHASDATPASALLLAYPVTDAPDLSRSSYRDRGEGYGLTAAVMTWFFHQYLDNPALAADPRVSPLRATDLSGLPPTWLLTAEFDPLRDEGIAFGETLAAAGVEVDQVHFADANHGFLSWAGTTQPSTRGVAAACEWLKRRLA